MDSQCNRDFSGQSADAMLDEGTFFDGINASVVALVGLVVPTQGHFHCQHVMFVNPYCTRPKLTGLQFPPR